MYSISICCVIVPSTHTFWQPMIYEQEKGRESFSHVSVTKLIPIYICIYLYLKYNCNQVVPWQYPCPCITILKPKESGLIFSWHPAFFMELKYIVVSSCVFHKDENHKFGQTIYSLIISSISSYLHTHAPLLVASTGMPENLYLPDGREFRCMELWVCQVSVSVSVSVSVQLVSQESQK